VFQQGEHVMHRNDPPTPKERKLSPAMKTFIIEKLSHGAKTTATKLFTALSAMVEAREIEGPAPKDTQVTDFIKTWRRENPRDSMAPMIQLCDGNLYDQLDLESLPERDMMILCDAQRSDLPGQAGSISRLGDGSEDYPYRVGMTCLRLVHDYIAVQNRSGCTTIFHVDSTHSMVINGYNVFAFGYLDRCGQFVLLAYFCTPQERAIDVRCCTSFMKRMCLDACSAPFAPQFMMADACKAQFNACLSLLPDTTVLMCWFHVTQNVWKQARKNRVSTEDTRVVFADLYDMHYATEAEFPVVRARVLERWDRFPLLSPVRRLTDHVKNFWVNSTRVSRWQAFYTPSGCAASNNPFGTISSKTETSVPGGPGHAPRVDRKSGWCPDRFSEPKRAFGTVAAASDRLLKLYRFTSSIK